MQAKPPRDSIPRRGGGGGGEERSVVVLAQVSHGELQLPDFLRDSQQQLRQRHPSGHLLLVIQTSQRRPAAGRALADAHHAARHGVDALMQCTCTQ